MESLLETHAKQRIRKIRLGVFSYVFRAIGKWMLSLKTFRTEAQARISSKPRGDSSLRHDTDQLKHSTHFTLPDSHASYRGSMKHPLSPSHLQNKSLLSASVKLEWRSWDFDVLGCDEYTLQLLIGSCFHGRFNLSDTFRISPQILQNFVAATAEASTMFARAPGNGRGFRSAHALHLRF